MTSTVMDAALLLQSIAGYDRQDPAGIDLPVPDYAATIAASTSSLRLGIPRAYFYEGLHPDIQAAMDRALSVLKGLTRTQRDIAPMATDATYASVMNAYRTILTAESYDNHRQDIAENPEGGPTSHCHEDPRRGGRYYFGIHAEPPPARTNSSFHLAYVR